MKTARLPPGEPMAEVTSLAVTYDAEVDAYCLRFMAERDQEALVEYWFTTLDRVESQASTVLGPRFVGWDD